MLEQILSILPQVIFDGLVLGFVYAMVALGYTMVYGVLELINFAHSEIFMIGAVVGVEVFRYLAPQVPSGFLLLLIALLLGGALAGGTAILVERFAYRPLRKRGTTNRLVPSSPPSGFPSSSRTWCASSRVSGTTSSSCACAPWRTSRAPLSSSEGPSSSRPNPSSSSRSPWSCWWASPTW